MGVCRMTRQEYAKHIMRLGVDHMLDAYEHMPVRSQMDADDIEQDIDDLLEIQSTVLGLIDVNPQLFEE